MNLTQKKIILLVLLVPSVFFLAWKYKEPYGFFMFMNLSLGAFCIYESLNPNSLPLPKIYDALFLVFGLCCYAIVAWALFFESTFNPFVAIVILIALIAYVIYFLYTTKSKKVL
ncbi:hypothetical protein MsAg5_06930 [Methanosarcinaceae archaeon Ag5]|uniref:Uncharacterized protein n=1 Tax=Methanolapillus africanus TaxID=3028297 RepID=A0AAE4MHS0_9EURY|nr:hypothetical protein [Methanosarcinaceae archaeon Ag5]